MQSRPALVGVSRDAIVANRPRTVIVSGAQAWLAAVECFPRSRTGAVVARGAGVPVEMPGRSSARRHNTTPHCGRGDDREPVGCGDRASLSSVRDGRSSGPRRRCCAHSRSPSGTPIRGCDASRSPMAIYLNRRVRWTETLPPAAPDAAAAADASYPCRLPAARSAGSAAGPAAGGQRTLPIPKPEPDWEEHGNVIATEGSRRRTPTEMGSAATCTTGSARRCPDRLGPAGGAGAAGERADPSRHRPDRPARPRSLE